MRRAAIVAALVCAFACALGAPAASARPTELPPLLGQVVDPSRQLAAGDADRLDRELEGLRKESGHAIVVLILASLDGESIDDVAYHAFNTWGVGGKGKDDGVLIVVATGDRRIRIEVGKGLGGALTDLQANDIIRKQIGPELARGHLYDGVDAGVRAVAAALAQDDATGPPPPEPEADDAGLSTTAYVVIGSVIAFFVLIAIGAAVSPGFRSALWPVLRVLGAILQLLSMFSGRGSSGRGGGGSSGDDDRYRGGGGTSGGGGSSDSY